MLMPAVRFARKQAKHSRILLITFKRFFYSRPAFFHSRSAF